VPRRGPERRGLPLGAVAKACAGECKGAEEDPGEHGGGPMLQTALLGLSEASQGLVEQITATTSAAGRVVGRDNPFGLPVVNGHASDPALKLTGMHSMIGRTDCAKSDEKPSNSRQSEMVKWIRRGDSGRTSTGHRKCGFDGPWSSAQAVGRVKRVLIDQLTTKSSANCYYNRLLL
jgi:hypothetical protein